MRGVRGGKECQYWLLKTEPGEWSWEDQAANGGLSRWDGVKNKQAQKHLKSMRAGDLCFFYHSGARSRRVVGVVSVVRTWYVEEGDGGGVVDVKAVGEMKRPVDLKEMKREDGLKGFVLFRQPRLSVVPVPEDVWDRVFEMGGGLEGASYGDEEIPIQNLIERNKTSRTQQDLDWLSDPFKLPIVKVIEDSIDGRAPPSMRTLGLSPSLSFALNRSWRKASSVRAFSSDHANQSHGGLSRFYSEVLPPSKGCSVHVRGDEFWHMTKVLRLSTNDRVELFNGKGGLIEGCIQRIDRNGLDFVALEDLNVVPPQTVQWHVFAGFGTLKGGRADWLVEKCTRLPLLTERSPSISENRVDRLQRVIQAAAKQSQRLHEMTLKPPLKFGGLLPIVAQSKLSFVAVAEATPVINFTVEEVSAMLQAGVTAVGPGPNRLRVETATIALLATLMLWSDTQQP
ncbi:hypothetical protein RJ639_033405 [Escallonia herrerae]|uniref:16S rRNA (uracil(1498)-N(3))-methyltransferase n=1 Tax=Escallonia herrerae TaxID=1293975 RepID=A0AA88WWU3_9ASTE|nr:hypothetical protein RJ639_033405 [Escallonia herrerae]